MSLSLLLFYFFGCLGIGSSMMVVLSRNPVFSVLFLILSFFNISALLFLLELEFLPIVFLVVYVGAVAVLFLFVLMMLNIKLAELRENTTHYLPIACFLFFYLLFRANFNFLFWIHTIAKSENSHRIPWRTLFNFKLFFWILLMIL